MVPSTSPAQTAPAPQPGAGQQMQGGGGQSPPMGQSPATGPTANRGYEAAAMQGMAVAVKALEQLLPLFGSGSDQGKDVMKAIQTLSKHIPPGAVTPAAERNQLEKMALQQTQDSQMMARMKQAQAAPQGQPPQGGMPQQRAA